MITIDNKQYRNLEEQVLKNQDDIKELQSISNLAELGIKIVSAEPLPTAEQLPNDYMGHYGDGILIGIEQPYELYIWTREDNEYGGEWFDWGPLNAPSTIQGPVGEQGPAGPQGTRGSNWYSQTGAPTNTENVDSYDQALNTATGDVYQFNNGVWQFVGNIRGPRGPQGLVGPAGIQGPAGQPGPQGPAGPQGQFIEIAGTLANINLLPDPKSVPRSTAYLIPISGIEHVFLIVGTTDLTWHDAGSFAGGSAVLINGTQYNEIDIGNLSPVQTYTVGTDTSALIDGTNIKFNNLVTTGTNLAGSSITNTASITLPIEAGSQIEPYISSGKLRFSLTDSYTQSILDLITQVIPTSVDISAPSSATSGQLTQQQTQTLTDRDDNYIRFNNEIYRLQDRMTDAGYLVYTHTGFDNNTASYIIKCITVTISTYGWVLTTHKLPEFSLSGTTLTITQ